MNFRQIKAIEKANKEKIQSVCPQARDSCGIYFLIREDESFRYAYIGQSVKVLTRLAQHLSGYQHIDLSIKKHGLWDGKTNPMGWRVSVMYCEREKLDELEQKYIKMYADYGYQLRNKTSGSQGEGKKDIADAPTKGYLEGLHNGYKKARQEMAHLFDLHLEVKTKKDPPTKLQERALAKFYGFIGRSDEDVNQEEASEQA